MHPLRSSPLIALLVAASLVASAPAGAAQVADRQAVAVVRPAGEVFVNQTRITGEQTLFANDTVQTGATGSAGIAVAGRAALTLEPGSRAAFSASPQYFVSLEEGRLSLRALAGARNFQVRVGRFVVVSSPEAESALQIERASDGAARVVCTTGWAAVIELDGPATVALKSGQAATISSQGELKMAAPSPTAAPAPAATPTAPTAKKKGGHTAAVLVAVAGGGAAAAAVALSRKGDKPVSPSVP